jgi:hypothetical protein
VASTDSAGGDAPRLRSTGRCMCGEVRIEVRGELRDVFNCHCHRCRRWTGHHMAATSAAREEVSVEDELRLLRWYSPTPEVEYGFCSRCGSSLMWRVKAGVSVSISAGVLDPPTHLRTVSAWWVTDASDYHDRPDVPELHTE